ncbi:peptide ABC transporter substrate-binding protein [Oceanirhabdus sp. W0125-5]|uniref:peptide ABC transporter substrate-binding protein n=1 Tax=Oceanirhabdus sp. W0125-5 TaxID=2999116 RepID=UPI0022F31C02|nr:ABC transporter substrate-binding protein [Oceanirhabdus sp. W0125-5]WBW95378.1 ABC transporter substrate-binding protein [Oceanirhabdus sp. W0125-5]
MKKALSIVLAMALTASVFVGCGKNNSENSAANNAKTNTANSQAEETKNNEAKENEDKKTENAGPTVWRDAKGTTKTLNPHTLTMKTEVDICKLIGSSFIKMVYDVEKKQPVYVPIHAAELPTVDESGKVWTIKMKKGLKWADGTPINANTYIYSVKMELDPKLKNSGSDLYFVDLPLVNAKEYFEGNCEWSEVGFKALDEYTVQFTLANEIPEIDFMNNCQIFPVHEGLYEAGMNEDRTETDYGTDISKVESCGPYVMTEWIRDQFKSFEKRPDAQTAPYYTPDRIEFRVIDGYAQEFQAFLDGQVEAVSVLGENFDKYADDPRLVYDEVNTVWGFYVNSDTPISPVLKDKNLRKALYHGMPRQSISKGIFRTFKPVGTMISSICMVDPDKGTKYKETEQFKAFQPANEGSDEALAKEYFEKAYAANGNKQITFEVMYFDNSETMKQMAEVMEETFENLFGRDKIDVQLKGSPANVAYDMYKEGKYDMGIGATGQDPFNPWASMKVYHSTYPERNITYKNEKFDELQERSSAGDLAFKTDERIAALVEMEKILLEQVVFIPVFQNNHAILYQDRINLHAEGNFYPIIKFAEYQCDIIE